MSLYAIGDLHACPAELDVLLDHIGPGADDTVVFLGDYVDRGPAARQVIDRLLLLREQGPVTVFLRGNHEDMLLDYLGYEGQCGEVYLANGGAATLASYGLAAVPGRATARRLPPTHLQFLLDCTLTHVSGGFLFVHAGVRPGVPLAEQSPEDLLWIREEFLLAPHDLPFTVVFGHTPHRDARIELPDRIGLDTGLVYGNKLSCLDATRRRLLQVAARSRRVTTQDLTDDFVAAGV